LGGQLGIFVAFGGAVLVGRHLSPYLANTDFTSETPQLYQIAASIGIIGSSDGPTSIFTASRLAPDMLPIVAIAAFSYMALVPIIQQPIMRLLTTPKERVIVMPEPKRVTRKQKIFFPIIVTAVVLLIVPTAGALIAMLMLGNLIRESGVAERFVRTLQGDVLNLLTLVVAFSIGSSARWDYFIKADTIIVILLGLFAFAFGTVGGVLVAKLLCVLTGGKVNPLIGNSGVSAMPMAARISQRMGMKYNPQNHLLMHAMGPIVSSTIGSAVIAGIFLAMFQ
jgi:oxaloacetate decarboxylase beta subunit